ncbi:MAG: tyrosine-protein phosphatase [Muribaculaceae bacterium]|nr:tyrosine-protein phosphatase [Muribaculaceae bacterium]
MRKVTFATLALCASMLSAQDMDVINIENDAVQAYLADETYVYNNDYGTSVIEQYYDKTLYGNKLDIPRGKHVTWMSSTITSQLSQIRIVVSENEDFSNAVTHYTKSLGARSYTISNMLPNRHYYYKVEEVLLSGEAKVVTSGDFFTEGQVRMINVDGVRNVRDLGGWPTQFNVPIRYERIYRSAHFDNITATGIHDFAENLNIGAELDLRGDSPHETSPLGDIDFKVLSGGQYYSGIQMKEKTATLLTWIIDRLREGKNVDLHCLVGADRAGLLSFIIEGVLGVEEIDLIHDYELSTFCDRMRPRSYEKTTNDTFAQLIPYIYTYGPADDLAKCFYNYCLDCGVSKEDLNYLRYVMLGIEDIGTGIVDVNATSSKPAAIYDINGVRHSSPIKGINIIVNSDGTVRKVVK